MRNAAAVGFLIFICTCSPGISQVQRDVPTQGVAQLQSLLAEKEAAIRKYEGIIGAYWAENEALKAEYSGAMKNYQDAVRAQHDYAISRFLHLKWLDGNSRNVFRWQLIAIYALFLVTLFVVGFSIVYAIVELRRLLPQPKTGLKTRVLELIEIEKMVSDQGLDQEAALRIFDGIKDKDGNLPTELTVGSTGVQVTSAATWVLVLAIAFAYLYLFVTEVMTSKTITFSLPTVEKPEATAASTPAAPLGSADPAPGAPKAGSKPCKGEECDPPGE